MALPEAQPGHRVAWVEPRHAVLPLVAQRLLDAETAPWTLLSPERFASWDGTRLRFGPGLGDARPPARGLPRVARENLARHAPAALDAAAGHAPRATSADDFVPAEPRLPALANAARTCTGCALHRDATQVVFGEGPGRARLLLVGEQPGDDEDVAGRPFVGPAGRLLDDALADAGIDRRQAYVTNAVKHFKFTLSGKRRLHAKPTTREVKACLPWLVAELDAIGPDVVVCLGATAAAALLGPAFRITRSRGEIRASSWAPAVLATWHPSAVLRAPDAESRARVRAELVADLRRAATALRG